VPHYVLDARTATPHFPGIGRYVSNLARALVPLLATDERLTVVCDPAHPIRLPPLEAVQTIPLAVSPFSLPQQWSVPRLLRRLPRTAPSAVIHAQDRWAPGRPSPIVYHSPYYLMPYRPGAATVLTVYDLIPLLFPQHSTARARLLFRWATALALRAADRVIAISAATRRDLLAHFRVPPDRVVAIPLAADPAFRPQPADAIAALRNRHHLPPGYVLYLGSNKPHKNLVRLVEAWEIVNRKSQIANRKSQIANRTLVMAGAWDARYPEARERAQTLGLGDRIRWLGPVAEAELPALYAGASLFVFPSLYEGFGLPVLEAMACGTPVICSNVSSLPEVAGDPSTDRSTGSRGTSGPAAALLVDPLDVAALAAAIGRALGDETLGGELRQNGLRQAARFTWERTAQQTLVIYRAQIGRVPGANALTRTARRGIMGSAGTDGQEVIR